MIVAANKAKASVIRAGRGARGLLLTTTALTTAALFIGFVGPADAATKVWTGYSSTNFMTGSNWGILGGGSVPGTNDDVVITVNPRAPALSADKTVGTVNLSANTLTVNSGSTLTVGKTFSLGLGGTLSGAGTVTTYGFAQTGGTVNITNLNYKVFVHADNGLISDLSKATTIGVSAGTIGNDITIKTNGVNVENTGSTNFGNGINAAVVGTGDISVVLGGNAKGTNDGIFATTNLIGGTSTIDISGTGDVTGVAGDGIQTIASGGQTHISVNGKISGDPGINSTSTTGAIIIDNSGDVEGTVDEGILATSNSGSITIDRDGNITGHTDGISASTGDDAGIPQVGTIDITVYDGKSVEGGHDFGSGAGLGDGINTQTATGKTTMTLNGNVVGTLDGIHSLTAGGAVEIKGDGTNTINGGSDASNGDGVDVATAGGAISVHGNGDINGGNGATTAGQGDGVHADSSSGTGAGGTIDILDNGNISGGNGTGGTGAGISANSQGTGGNGGKVTIQGNGAITGNGTGNDGINVNASTDDTSTYTGGDIVVGGSGAGEANGVISGGGDGIDLTTNGAGTISIDVADLVTGNGGAGITTSSDDSVSIENVGTADVTIEGKSGAGINVVTTSDGVTGSHAGDEVELNGSSTNTAGSATVVGSTDGIAVTTGGAAINAYDWNVVGKNGDGLNLVSGNGAANGGQIDVHSLRYISGSNNGISADATGTTSGGDINVRYNGQGAVAGPYNGNDGINGTNGDGVYAVTNGTGTITIGSLALGDGDGNFDITGGTNGLELTTSGGAITVGENGDIVGNAGDGILADSSNPTNNGGAVYIFGNGTITGTGTGSDGVHVDATTGDTLFFNGGNITVGGTGTDETNGAITGDGDGMDLATNGTGTITVVTDATVTGNGAYGITTSSDTGLTSITVGDDVSGDTGGIDVSSAGEVTVVLANGSGTEVKGVTSGNGINIVTTDSNNAHTVIVHGSSGTVVGPTDGIHTVTNGAAINEYDLDAVVGLAGDGFYLSSNGDLAGPAGSIDVSDIGYVLGTGNNGIYADATSTDDTGGDITIQGSGLGAAGGPYIGQDGITGGVGAGIYARASGLTAGGAITIGSLNVGDGDGNGDITGATTGLNLGTAGGTIVVGENGNILGQSESGIVADASASTGSGGTVNIFGNGNITGTGANANGITVYTSSSSATPGDNGGTITISGNGAILGGAGGGSGRGIYANSQSTNGNGGTITIQGNGTITGTSGGYDGIFAAADTASPGSYNGGDVIIGGTGANETNGAVNGSGDGMDLSTNGTGIINVVVGDDVTGGNDVAIGGHGILTTSENWVSIENVGGSGVTIQGGGTGFDGIHVATTWDGTGGTHAGQAVTAFGSSGTVLGPTDGINMSTGGADISVHDWDRVEGANGDGLDLKTSNAAGNAGAISVADVLAVLGTGGNGIKAVADGTGGNGGAITIQRSGTGYDPDSNPSTTPNYTGITGTGGAGIFAESTATAGFTGGAITIGSANLGDGDGNGDITGSTSGLRLQSTGGAITVGENGNILGQGGVGIYADSSNGAGNGGAVYIFGNRDITGTPGDGIHVYASGTTDGGNITIGGLGVGETNGDISGNGNGIDLTTNGVGTIDVVVNHDVTGGASAGSGHGIRTSAENGQTTITLEDNTVATTISGTYAGILSTALGTGGIEITRGAGNNVAISSGSFFDGIDAETDTGAVVITLNGAGNVTGGTASGEGGIYAKITSGTANNVAISIDSDAGGTVVSGDSGVMVNSASTVTNTLYVGSGDEVFGYSYAVHNLAGALTVTNDGLVDAPNPDGTTPSDALFTQGGSVTFDNNATAVGMLESGAGTTTVVNNANGATWRLTTDGVTSTNGLAGSDTFNNAGQFLFAGNTTLGDSTLGGLETFNNFIGGNGGLVAIGATSVTPQSLTFAKFGTFDNTNGVIDLTTSSAAGDNINFQGGAYTGTGGTINLDLMMNGTGVDYLTANSYAGSTNFDFTLQGSQSIWAADQKIFDTSTALGGTYTATGLPTPGVFIYTLQDDGQDIFVHQDVNVAALGGIAGNITLVQSTLGTVVNRPSSPFVGGLVADVPPGYCGLGPWQRDTGGTASASGETHSTSGPSISGTSSVDMTYVGSQFGLDVSCFNVGGSGVDISVGAIGGFNGGSSTQVITVPASVTTSEFNQQFAGVYATIAKGDFAADIQARGDFTDFVFDNSAISLNDAPLHTDRYSVSGSASYRLAVGEMNLIPAAGFSLSQTTSSALTFSSMIQPPPTLQPNDSNSYTGYVGATLNKVIVLPDGATAAIPFVTATLYNDFAPNPTSTFTDSSGNTIDLESQNLGMFGEASVGLNFVKLLDSSTGGPKQFSASVRADAKFSDRLEGFGLTGQARAQF